MPEPTTTPNSTAFQMLGAKEYASFYMLELSAIRATGPSGQHTQADIDHAAAERRRIYESIRDADGAVRRPAVKPPRAQHTNPNHDGMVTRTEAQMNSELYADPEAHRALWALGVRSIDKPEEAITYYPDPGPAWNPKPVLVDNGDGTGQWITPAPKYDQPGSFFGQYEALTNPVSHQGHA
jgi:hypothetical protein